MIYKYMVASLPVPRDLLFPLTTTPPGTTAASQSPRNPLSFCFRRREMISAHPFSLSALLRLCGGKKRCAEITSFFLNLFFESIFLMWVLLLESRFPLKFRSFLMVLCFGWRTVGGRFNLRLSNSTDPEPGRCKRTDGKKWRCSRDVAPDQKYCERHMHRGRPRSRKHVEVHATAASKRVRHDINLAPPLPTVSPETVSISNPANGINKNVCSSQFMGSNLHPYHPSPVFPERDSAKFASFESMNSASANREPRSVMGFRFVSRI